MLSLIDATKSFARNVERVLCFFRPSPAPNLRLIRFRPQPLLHAYRTVQFDRAHRRCHQATRLFRRWCIPRFATSLDLFRRGCFCTLWLRTRRFDRSGGEPRREPPSSSSPSGSSKSNRDKDVMMQKPFSYPFEPCANGVVCPRWTLLCGTYGALQFQVFKFAFSIGVMRSLRSRASGLITQFLQNVSCFAAQQSDVALAIDARQIHPHAQLPRPHLARCVVRFSAHRQQRAVACRQLLHQAAQQRLAFAGCRLQINQCQINSIS